jgi:hypothetical protein
MAGAPEFPYSDELADEICEVISTGIEGLDKLCSKPEYSHWPKPRTIYKWLFNNESFSQKYARAKEYQQDCLIDDVITRSYDRSNDMVIGDDGRVHSNMAAIQRDRLIADNAKWVAGRLSRRYKDKQQVDTSLTVVHEDSIKDLA